MKHKPFNSPALGVLEIPQAVLNLLNFCESAGVYIVNNNQQVIYWNQALTHLTGISSNTVLHQHCPGQFHIDHNQHQTTKILSVKLTDKEVELTQYSEALFNQKGVWAGSIGLIQAKQNTNLFTTPNTSSYDTRQNFHGIISRAPTMEPVFQLVQNAAATEVTVLVRGESGSGKELVAKAIHDLSYRKNQPFLAINCAALSSNLLESELFGHMRGAFTGAIKDHKGLFERAKGGTLFLDEVAELPLDLQAKLLRVLQERNFIPVGGNHTVDVDVRIVAATHRSLREEVKHGRFREDLMYRLRVVPIFIPPLRDRREDINLLLWHFIRQHNDEVFRRIEMIEPQAMRVLMDYHWPGNIRELQNVVEYAFVVGHGATISMSDLPPEFREPSHQEQIPVKNTILLPDQEAEAIRQALAATHGKVNLAAEQLGMSRATFWRKRKQYEI